MSVANCAAAEDGARFGRQAEEADQVYVDQPDARVLLQGPVERMVRPGLPTALGPAGELRDDPNDWRCDVCVQVRRRFALLLFSVGRACL